MDKIKPGSIMIEGNLKEYVVKHIRDEILIKKKLTPGSRISEREYAKNLNISRAPVREALKELEEQGIVTSISYRGWFVSDFREEEFIEISKLRSLLEFNLLECMISHGGYDERDINQLITMNDELKKIVQDTKRDQKALDFIDKEMEFHNQLLDMSGNLCKWTRKMLHNLYYQIYCTFDRWFHTDTQMEKSITAHELIIRSLKQKDADQLREIITKRIGKEQVIKPE